MTSLLALAVGDPANASASSSVMAVPVIGILPGARTSPMTYTNWLLYWLISTRTCGFRM